MDRDIKKYARQDKRAAAKKEREAKKATRQRK